MTGHTRKSPAKTEQAKSSVQTPAHPLEDRIGYRFHNPSLLQLALTHSSLAFERATSDPQDRTTNRATNRATTRSEEKSEKKAEKRPASRSAARSTSEDNEQLEFVGDAVVGLLVAESLFRRFSQRGEGDLTRMRALLVSRKHMGEVGARLGLGEHLLLGRGEEQSGGRRKPALLANTMEAVIAAIYLDHASEGLAAARTFVEREIVAPKLAELEDAASDGAAFGGVIGDFKSALQELLQARGDKAQARYITTAESGPDHRKHFRVEASLRSATDHTEVVLASGEGSTKKEAQQAAARIAYEALRAQQETVPSAHKRRQGEEA